MPILWTKVHKPMLNTFNTQKNSVQLSMNSIGKRKKKLAQRFDMVNRLTNHMFADKLFRSDRKPAINHKSPIKWSVCIDLVYLVLFKYAHTHKKTHSTHLTKNTFTMKWKKKSVLLIDSRRETISKTSFLHWSQNFEWTMFDHLSQRLFLECVSQCWNRENQQTRTHQSPTKRTEC